jgi:RNA polymerase sigma factor (sigma-70 family)
LSEPGAERANELALAYRAGRTDLLPKLFEELRPILWTTLARYGGDGRPLPPALDGDDLLQQTWLILDTLVRRWCPEGGDFGAYVRTSFPWELWRYVQGLTPRRGARDVRVDNVRHDDLIEWMDEQPGIDGRLWERGLILAEMLDHLEPLPRRVLLLHLIGERYFGQIADDLRLTETGAFREYRRALDSLRRQAGLEGEPDEGLPAGPSDSRALERLVRALHEGAGRNRRLPGRNWVCARTGISENRFTWLIGLLVERGCIVGRSARRAGRLVHATPAETLAQASLV